MKRGDCFARQSIECKMKARAGRTGRWLQLQAQLVFAVFDAVADSRAGFKYSPKAQRLQSCVVERASRFKIGDSERDVMQHAARSGNYSRNAFSV